MVTIDNRTHDPELDESIVTIVDDATEAEFFVRGDADGSGKLDVSDTIAMLDWLFAAGPKPRCLDTVDLYDDGEVDLSSVIALLNHLFLGGDRPVVPYPKDLETVNRPPYVTLVLFLSISTTGESEETIHPKWQVLDVAEGVTPVFDFDSQGRVHMMWFTDDSQEVGPLSYGVAETPTSEFTVVGIANGYFYGPGDLRISRDDVVHCVWHEHLGNPQHARIRPNGSRDDFLFDTPGEHDGWDNSLTFDSDGILHHAALFPVLHGAVASLQYGYFRDDSWTFETIEGSGISMYGLRTSIQTSFRGVPNIVYCQTEDRTSEGKLIFARGPSPGSDVPWSFETIVEGGLVGRFPCLSPSLTVAWCDLDEDDPSRGTIRWARKESEQWQIETVTTVSNVRLDFCDSRRPLTLDLDADRRQVISFSDARRVIYARRSENLLEEGTWNVETVLESSEDLYMGVSVLRFDSFGHPAIALWQRDEDHELGLVRLASLQPADRPVFHRGDVNDDGKIDIGDPVALFSFLFLGTAPEPSCHEAADSDNSGSGHNLSDGVFLLNFLFSGGSPPVAPGPPGSGPCGPDPDTVGSRRDRGCESYESCAADS